MLLERSLNLVHFIDCFKDHLFLCQVVLHLFCLLFFELGWYFVSIFSFDLLIQSCDESSLLIELFLESRQLILYIDVISQVQENLVNSDIGYCASFGWSVVLTADNLDFGALG